MTRTDLHSITGFHAPSLLAAAAHLRATMPRTKADKDPTSLIRNEGHMNGYLDAIEALIAAASQQPPPAEKKPVQPYSQPPGFQQPNQNRP